MRQLVSTALVALIVAALTAVTVSAVAQQPAPLAPAAVSPVNADKVDGKHAVGAKVKVLQRKNKLVATDRTGFLPSNIAKPLWGLIKGKPAFLADDQVSWAEVASKPADLADGSIGWGEVRNIPAGFADGVDNAGVTGIKVKVVTSTTPATLTPGTFGIDTMDCPAGYLAVSGGYQVEGYVDVFVYDSSAWDSDTWRVKGYRRSDGVGTSTLRAQVICIHAEPAGATVAAKSSTFGPAKLRVRKP